MCWGWGIHGNLGNGSTNNSSLPVEVNGINNATKITSSPGIGWHSCALLNDGKIACWGDGSSGQLGNNSNTLSSTPIFVIGFEK